MAAKDRLRFRRVRADECGELKDKTVTINRVAKVVKGGRRFSFSALVVTGDNRGHIGFGLGKAGEVPDAIRKASDRAKKNLIKVPMRGTSIPHEVIGKFGPSSVLMKPAVPGSGVIAGSVVRAVVEAAGVKDIHTKCIGSSNAYNVLHAVLDGLMQLRDAEAIASVRNLSPDEMGYTL